MLLYLVRHGEAKSADQDPERPLSETGEEQARRVAGALARLEPDLRAIWHSGKRRAEQTAGVFATALAARTGPRLLCQARPQLDPGDCPEGLIEQLRAEEGDLLVVGHLPHLARVATALLFGREAPQALDLEAAAVLCLQRTGEQWALQWLLTPALCP